MLNKTHNIMMLVIGIIFLFITLANLSTDIISASESVENSQLPLSQLFGLNGIIVLSLMVGILVLVIRQLLKEV